MIHRSNEDACYNSLPFFGPNVGVLASTSNPDEYAHLAAELTATAIDLARDASALSAVFYSAFNPNDVPLRNPAIDSRTDVVRLAKHTLYIRLNQQTPPDWPATIRYDLRKGLRAGVEVSSEYSPDYLDPIFEIYRQNCHDYGIPPKPRRCLKVLHERSQHSRSIRCYTARLAGQVIGGLIVFHGLQTVSYYLPCSLREYRELQPGSLLIDVACRDAATAGMRFWNWESSPDDAPGVRHFKKKWGSESSSYEICVVPLADTDRLTYLQPHELADRFPYYFVYPYELLGTDPN
jgi:hypothetical protein